jgi:hypothetical protein
MNRMLKITNVAIVIICFALCFATPIASHYYWLKDLKGFKYYLLFIAGFSNVVGLTEISRYLSVRQKDESKTEAVHLLWYKKWTVLAVFFLQSLLLAFILGLDIALLVSSTKNSIVIIFSLIGFVVLLIVFLAVANEKPHTANQSNSNEPIIVILSIILAGMVALAILVTFAGEPERVFTFFSIPDFCQARIDSYVHLVIIPLIYFVGDVVNGIWCGQKAIRSSVALDFGLLLVGICCVFLGLYSLNLNVQYGHLFEAGSGAAIMTFANYMYLVKQQE